MPNAHDLLFRALGDPTRRAIFERLCRKGEQTVGALTARSHAILQIVMLCRP